MDSLEITARAKINLSLDVTGKRPDGYHEVEMIMQSLELHDRVFLEKTGDSIEICCGHRWVPANSENTAYKAARLFLDKYKPGGGIRITIDKHIPVSAGLAGGSTDAAAVLKGMNILYGVQASEEDLMAIGKMVGADVPYCIKGGTMLARGIGEILSPLPGLPQTHIVLVKPDLGVSTAWVYKNLDLSKISDRPDTAALAEAVGRGDISFIGRNMRNVLESVTIPRYRVVQRIKESLLKAGALGSMMSGSGPTVFGIFMDEAGALRALESLKHRKWQCIATKTC